MTIKQDTISLLDIKGGEQPDTDYIELPAWKRLRNVYVDSAGKPRSRPHFVPVSNAYIDPRGLLFGNENELMFVGDGKLDNSTQTFTTIDGDLPVRYDAHRTYTVLTAGGQPILFRDAGDYVRLPQTNVKCLATFQGAQKLRMVYVKTDDLHRLYFTDIGDLTDEGSVIVDPHGYADDEYTEAFSIKNFPYEIVDLKDLNEGIFLFTTRGVYPIGVGYDDNGFRPKIGSKAINIEVVDSPVRVDEGRLWCLSPDGAKVIFYEDGYPTFTTLDMVGIDQTIIPTDESTICVDKLRNLIFVCPNTSDGITFVYHLDHKLWTTWDVMIRDTISVRGVTYAVLADSAYITKMDEVGIDNEDWIDVEFRSGLTPMPTDSPEARKRLRYGHIKFHRSRSLYFYFESVGGQPITDVDPVWVETTEPRLLTHYFGDQDELFAFSLNFRTDGFIVFDELLVDTLLKRPRILG